ncbi:MAG: hypothetical protein RR609_06660, partial [Aurantimicrobium sp.]
MFGWILLATFWTLLPIALINYIAFEFGLGFGSKEGVKLLWIATTCAVVGLVNSFMLFIISEVCFDLLVKKLKKGVCKMNAANPDLYHQIGKGYVKTPTSVTDPYPCLLQPESLTALERYKLFWLYCHTFNTFPCQTDSWAWQIQLGINAEISTHKLFCYAFTEIYSRTRPRLTPENCPECPLRQNRVCSELTYNYQDLLRNNLLTLAQDYAWNMLNFWTNPAGRLRDIEKIRNESGVFLRRELI